MVDKQRDRTIDLPAERGGTFLAQAWFGVLGSVLAEAAVSSDVAFVGGNESSAVAHPEKSCEENMSPRGQGYGYSMTLGRQGWLLMQTSTCWDCVGEPLGDVSPSTAEGPGRSEWAQGWCSVSLLPDCSVLEYSKKHEPEDSGLYGSNVVEGVVVPGSDGGNAEHRPRGYVGDHRVAGLENGRFDVRSR